MKRFQFHLDALLRTRRREEERRLTEFRQKQRAFLEVRGEADRLAAEREDRMDALERMQEGDLPMEDILAQRRFLNHLSTLRIEAGRLVNQRQKEVDAARVYLDEAARDRKVVERLRERKHGEYMEVFRRAETKEMDEIGRNRLSIIDDAPNGATW